MNIYNKNYFNLKKIDTTQIIYGFFSKEGGFSKKNYTSLNCNMSSGDNKEVIKKNIEISKINLNIKNHRLKFIKQTHSSKIFVISKNNFNLNIEADGIITKDKTIALAILTADCAPIFIYDKKYSLICALHSGWKGCFNNIIKNAIMKIRDINSNENNLNAIIGPCLGKNNFEVSEEFKNNFIKKEKLYECFFIKKLDKVKYLFDMRGLINYQLMQNSINNISNIDIDTYANKNLFFSHRRSFQQKKLPTGRMINIIAFKANP